MSARHMKGTRRFARARAAATPSKPPALAATGRFLAVALLAVAAAGVMTFGETDVLRVSSTLSAITTFDMH
jgi:hypothetical protein